MPTPLFEQTASTHARPTASVDTDASRFVGGFAQAFGAATPAIFDQLSADDLAAMTAVYGVGSVTLHQATMAIIDDGLTVLCARVRYAGQAYQLWQPIHDVDTGPVAITSCWYLTALLALDAAPERSCTPTGAILAESPSQALQTLILTLASPMGMRDALPADAGADDDRLTQAIVAAAAIDAAQPCLAELTIAMIQGDLEATRSVLEATFGAAFAQPTLWTVAYQRSQSGVGEALLTERSRDATAAGPRYRLCVVSTPSSWRWLLKSLDGTRSSVDFATSDCPATMERRLLRALGALRGQR